MQNVEIAGLQAQVNDMHADTDVLQESLHTANGLLTQHQHILHEMGFTLGLESVIELPLYVADHVFPVIAEVVQNAMPVNHVWEDLMHDSSDDSDVEASGEFTEVYDAFNMNENAGHTPLHVEFAPQPTAHEEHAADTSQAEYVPASPVQNVPSGHPVEHMPVVGPAEFMAMFMPEVNVLHDLPMSIIPENVPYAPQEPLFNRPWSGNSSHQ